MFHIVQIHRGHVSYVSAFSASGTTYVYSVETKAESAIKTDYAQACAIAAFLNAHKQGFNPKFEARHA